MKAPGLLPCAGVGTTPHPGGAPIFILKTPSGSYLVRRLLDISEGSEIEWVLSEDGSVQVKKVG